MLILVGSAEKLIYHVTRQTDRHVIRQTDSHVIRQTDGLIH